MWPLGRTLSKYQIYLKTLYHSYYPVDFARLIASAKWRLKSSPEKNRATISALQSSTTFAGQHDLRQVLEWTL